jgi:hypothetical protein
LATVDPNAIDRISHISPPLQLSIHVSLGIEFATEQLAGRTARNAVPVDPAVRITNLSHSIIECVLLTET